MNQSQRSKAEIANERLRDFQTQTARPQQDSGRRHFRRRPRQLPQWLHSHKIQTALSQLFKKQPNRNKIKVIRRRVLRGSKKSTKEVYFNCIDFSAQDLQTVVKAARNAERIVFDFCCINCSSGLDFWLTSATKPSSSVSRTEEVRKPKRERRTGRMTRRSFLWSWTRLAVADWKPVCRSSALLTIILCLHPKCRMSWTQRACHTFLWSKRMYSHWHRKLRMSSSNWLMSAGN